MTKSLFELRRSELDSFEYRGNAGDVEYKEGDYFTHTLTHKGLTRPEIVTIELAIPKPNGTSSEVERYVVIIKPGNIQARGSIHVNNIATRWNTRNGIGFNIHFDNQELFASGGLHKNMVKELMGKLDAISPSRATHIKPAFKRFIEEFLAEVVRPYIYPTPVQVARNRLKYFKLGVLITETYGKPGRVITLADNPLITIHNHFDEAKFNEHQGLIFNIIAGGRGTVPIYARFEVGYSNELEDYGTQMNLLRNLIRHIEKINTSVTYVDRHGKQTLIKELEKLYELMRMANVYAENYKPPVE